MSFWIVSTVLSAVVAAPIVLALLRGRQGGEPAAAYDLRVYRDQLKEIDRDLARGAIDEADAEPVRAEVSRRILAADAQMQKEAVPGGGAPRLSWAMAGLATAALVGGSYYVYRNLGSPFYGDLPLSKRFEMAEFARGDRPDQARAEATVPARPSPELSPDFVELMTRLREVLAVRPDDIQGHILLARNEARSGNFAAAHAAQARAIDLKGADATSVDYADLADMMILAAGGYVSPEAEVALVRALELEPNNGAARYYWGSMMAQTGRPDIAFRIWERQLREGPEAAPWIPPIRAQIQDIAVRAGVNYTPPPISEAPALPGPSAEDIEAAGEMSPVERMQTIEGMVAGLAERLATDGGSPEEWARLIASLGVLGRTGEARAIYENALEVFADAPTALDTVKRAAEQARVGG